MLSIRLPGHPAIAGSTPRDPESLENVSKSLSCTLTTVFRAASRYQKVAPSESLVYALTKTLAARARIAGAFRNASCRFQGTPSRTWRTELRRERTAFMEQRRD